tara:strand:- start:681 stop:1274 length:594 start_codon:yes stop_codon:yes gene_type:complete
MAKLKINDLPNNTELDTDDSFEISKHNGGDRFSAHINYSDMLSAIEEDLTPIHDLPSTSGLDDEDSFEISKFNGGDRFPAHINYNDMLAEIEADLTSNLVDSGSNANGYFREYSDGYIEQWGTTPTVVRNSVTVIPFAVPFTDTASMMVFAMCDTNIALGASQDSGESSASTYTINNFTLGSAVNQNTTFKWFAGGY